MSYFALALVCLLGALLLMVSGFGYPAMNSAAPQTLAVVHLVAIGWLSMLMCGALFQFVPVLIARPLHSDSLPLLTIVCLAAGLVLLTCGFLHLAGLPGPGWNVLPWSVLPLGGALLGLGFALAIYNLGRTLWAARPLTLPARFVTMGLACLAATVLLGFAFTLVLGGASGSLLLAELTVSGLPLHVIAGLGGWLTFTALGVSYRLLAMFMLAPELDGASTRAALWCGVAALTLAIVGGVAAIWGGFGPWAALTVAGLLALAALGSYGADIARLYRRRKRRVIELNSRMAGVALAHLAATVLLAIALTVSGTLGLHAGALVFFAAFGWLTGLGLAKLFKIVAFLTWLECYGPVLGKVDAPRVQDLVVEPRAARWFWLYFAAVDLAVLALLAGVPGLARIGIAAMLLAVGAIGHELIRIRRLSDVRGESRLPPGTHAPRLLVSTVQHA
jgi:hypothetical protein